MKGPFAHVHAHVHKIHQSVTHATYLFVRQCRIKSAVSFDCDPPGSDACTGFYKSVLCFMFVLTRDSFDANAISRKETDVFENVPFH